MRGCGIIRALLFMVLCRTFSLRPPRKPQETFLDSTADLFDANADTVSVCELQFRSFGKKQRFFGPCVPLLVNEDHRPVLAMLSTPGEGRVLVVDAGGSLRVGVMGDRLAAIAVENNWAGVVVHGAIRDSTAIDALDIGVKSLGTTARRCQTERGGLASAPVRFGGVEFSAGDWVYADVDAVLASPRQLAFGAPV